MPAGRLPVITAQSDDKREAMYQYIRQQALLAIRRILFVLV